MSRMVTAKKIEFVMDAYHVKRYHTERILEEDTLGHHSAGVAYICSVLKPSCGKDLLMAALLHDIGEKFTGDTPAPFKRLLRRDGVLEERYEYDFLKDKDVYPYILTTEDEQVLKAADLLNLIYKSADEIKMGNQLMVHVLGNGIMYLNNLTLPLPIAERVKECVESVWNAVRGLILDKSVALITVRAVEDISIGISSQITDSITSKGRSQDTSIVGDPRMG